MLITMMFADRFEAVVAASCKLLFAFPLVHLQAAWELGVEAIELIKSK